MVVSIFDSRIDEHVFSSTPDGTSGDANSTRSHSIDVPVLIVGGGPTGLLQSHLLSKLGVKSMVVERYPERLGAPKAHALSPRSLEICRQAGLDGRRIRELGTKRADAFWVRFLTNLSGKAVGVLPYERMDPAVLKDTPEMIHNIPQPIFEQFVTEYLAQDPNVDLRKGLSFASLEQSEGNVDTTVEERTTGHKFRIHSRYVIACDGARSSVRRLLGIESEGEDSYETMMTIHFKANLRPVVGERVGMLHWLMDPEVGAFIIAYDLSGNAVLISNFDADKHPVETWNHDLCKEVLAKAIGKSIDFDIHSYRPWILSRKVAMTYRSGNVFLAGDAAHSFPPTGGLGLNSGLADVHNLAYKIAAVYHGYARDPILDTYTQDRRQVAIVNSLQSVKNGKQIFGLLKTMGLTGTNDIQTARENLYATISDPTKRAVIDENIEAQREHFDNLELHIGYVYGSDKIPPHASHFEAKFVAGARLPHVWIVPNSIASVHSLRPIDVSYVTEMPTEEVSKRTYSILDLCAIDTFTVIVGESVSWQSWTRDFREHFIAPGPKMKVCTLGVEFELAPVEGSQKWLQLAGLAKGEALLIRPDQHILMQFNTQTPMEQIISVIDSHLGR